MSLAGKQAILVTGADLAKQALALLGGYEVVYAGKAPTEDDLVALCERWDPVAIIVRYGRIGERVIAAAPSLKVISKHGSGTDTIDKVAAAKRRIQIAAAAGANAAAVAEQALALMLACAKSVVHLDARMRAGHWDKPTHKSLELAGRTLGLVGLGAIGLRMARMAHAMEMNVIGFDPYASNMPAYIRAVDLEAIWTDSEVISLHCPLTQENAGFVNAHALARCRRGVMLVNTARGGLIDEAALLAALHSGQVAAAGLDTFESEPLGPGNPFVAEENLVLSPHIGGITSDAYVNMGVAAVKNALAVLVG